MSIIGCSRRREPLLLAGLSTFVVIICTRFCELRSIAHHSVRSVDQSSSAPASAPTRSVTVTIPIGRLLESMTITRWTAVFIINLATAMIDAVASTMTGSAVM